MKIIYMGTPDFAVAPLAALAENGYEVEAVITQPDKPKGRGKTMMPTPVKEEALKHGIPVLQPVKVRDPEFVEELKNLAPDIIIVAAFGQIIPKSILDMPRFGCINIHASLLPKYRGAGPIQWAVLNDEAETGITTMLMGEGMDTGDILVEKATPIGENETAAELFDRLAEMGAEVLVDTLEKLGKGEITPVKQDESLATYAPMLTKELCPIDFTKPVRKIHKQICGLSDWPCATTVLEGKRLKVYRSEIASTKPCEKPAGTVVDNSDFSVACSDGVIRFTQVQAEGSKRMDTADFLRGRHIENGTVLG